MRSQRIRRAGMGALLVAGALLTPALATTSSAGAARTTINLVAFLRASDEFPAHSRYLTRLSTPEGTVVGSSLWTCARKSGHFRCTDTYTLAAGKLTTLSTAAGSEFPYPKTKRKIVSGTGAYANAAGTVAVKLLTGDGFMSGSRYSVTISLASMRPADSAALSIQPGAAVDPRRSPDGTSPGLRESKPSDWRG